MHLLRSLLSSLIGEISWNPPVWIQSLISRARRHPRSAAAVLVAFLLLVAGGVYLHHYISHLPKPHRVLLTAFPISGPNLVPDNRHLPPPHPLILNFSESAAPITKINKIVEEGIRIDPNIPGFWKWQGDRHLAFFPLQEWPAGRSYHVTLDPKIVSPHILLDRRSMDVSTPPFTVEIPKLEFYQDPTNASHKEVVATLQFSHPIAEGELEKHLHLSLVGGSQIFPPNTPPFSVDYANHHRTAYIHSAPITLPELEDFMKVTIDTGMSTTQGGATLSKEVEEKVRIPNRFSLFRIDSVEGSVVEKESGEPEQVIVINTTADAKSEEVAKGLEIYLLPKKEKTPDPNAKDAPRRFNQESDDDQAERTPQSGWESPSQVTDEILKQSTLLPFTTLPTQHPLSRQHCFKIDQHQPGNLYIRLKKGIVADGDFILSEDFNSLIPVPYPQPDISFQGKGGVMALGGERKLSVRSRAVPAIDYEVDRVPAGEINHLVSQTEGDFQNPNFRSGSFDEADMARIGHEKIALNTDDHFKPNYSSFDFSKYLQPAASGQEPLQGLFFIKAKGWNPISKKFMQGSWESRFILVTDIGILVKENADGSREVYLESLKEGKPLPDISVEILARNGTVDQSGTSDQDGHCSFASLGKQPEEKKPVAIVARKGNDVSFIPFSRNDRQLDFSRFDTGGVDVNSQADLDAFLFTERGIYRPGDEIHVGFTVKQRNWEGSLTGLPLEIEVVDSRGRSVQTKKISLDAGGLNGFTYATRYESPTGEYAINLYLVRNGKRDLLLGSTTAIVKEFLPDRLKIAASLSETVAHGWIHPENIHANVELHNLYGTPASDRKIEASLQLSPCGFQFEEYPGYSFYDRLPDSNTHIRSQTVSLGENKTDENGSTHFDLKLERFADATYAMHVNITGFEAEGGRSVSTDCTALVSPLASVVGCKKDTDSDTLAMGSKHTVEFIAIDPTLKKIKLVNLVMNLVQISYISVLTRQPDGTYSYKSLPRENTIQSEEITLPEEGLTHEIPAAKPGEYFLEIKEKTSGHRIAITRFQIIGNGDVSVPLDKHSDLSVKLDRNQYDTGDDISVNITAPYTGSGLITIERDKVYAAQWFHTDTTSSLQHIRLPKGLDGTGYVNVSFIRALDDKQVMISPLSYGIAPFTANKDTHQLGITLGTPPHTEPGKSLHISYKTDHPAKIILFAVDEGILQVTHFELPDPLAYFYRKQSLTVKTTQIVDLILPEFSLLRSAAFGGDSEGRQLNPFKRITEKPVVFWSGVVDADSTEKDVVYEVPDYFNGTLKIMAVAVSEQTVGSAQMESLVQGPFVLTPGVPTFAAPGDRFQVGVTVANNVKDSGTQAQVNVSVNPSEGVTVEKPSVQQLQIPEGKEKTVIFSFRAGEQLGSAALNFRASLGDSNIPSSSLRSTLSIRPPTPKMTQVVGGSFTGEECKTSVTRALYPQYRKLDALLSAVPLGLAHGLVDYLSEYPHGCSEQLTSSAFAHLMVSDDSDLGLDRAEVAARMEKSFEVLRGRQNARGAFGLWATDDNEGIDFVSVYVMHFLLEAKAAGFVPPNVMVKNGLSNLQRMVIQQPQNLDQARTIAYAIYLLTRDEEITTNYILNLQDYLEKNYPKQWQGDLTGVYLAGSWSLLKREDEAKKLISAYHLGTHPLKMSGDYYQPLCGDAQYLSMISRHFPQLLKQISAKEFENITAPIARGDFNTLSAAYAVLALKNYSQSEEQRVGTLSITQLSKDGVKSGTTQTKGLLFNKIHFAPTTSALLFAANPPIGGPGAFFQTIEEGYDAQLPDKVIASGMEVHREIVDGHNKPVTTVKLGEELTVRLIIRSLDRERHDNIALVDLLPGGFEILPTSLSPGAGQQGCDFVELREDRAVFYTSIELGIKVITYRMKPTNIGEFVVPPLFAESMYDRKMNARDLPARIKVIEGE